MDEGGGMEAPAGSRRRVLERLRARRAGSDAALHVSLPPLGTTVGGFVLEALLGQGGYGTVYLARRGGCLFAVKLISLPQAGEWARREPRRHAAPGGGGRRGPQGPWPLAR
ncbi:hypothetical protein ACN28I_23455 [Archangium gephyra]|uniref:hypothetical protein n=1 Tax=Archangium gephyra TaxID=48 RepID=UPI003B80E79E